MSESKKRRQVTSSGQSSDRIARIGVIASSALALASIVVSCASYREQKQQFAEVQTEKLLISLTQIEYEPIRVTPINFGKDGRVVIAPWKLTLSNTGQQRLSITSYEISEGIRPGERYYTGLRSGMFDGQEKLAELPITMEPGDSKVFALSVGTLVSEEVGAVLVPAADPETGFVMKPALALAEKNLDLLGNRVTYERWPTGEKMTTLTHKPAQTFWYAAKTGRNNTFYGSGQSVAPSPTLERFGHSTK